jgi:hypothetical protein
MYQINYLFCTILLRSVYIIFILRKQIISDELIDWLIGVYHQLKPYFSSVVAPFWWRIYETWYWYTKCTNIYLFLLMKYEYCYLILARAMSGKNGGII